MTEETLINLLLKTPEAEREALLDRASAGKPGLRKRVELLLKADAASSPVLIQPIQTVATAGYQATASYASAGPTPSVVIAGRYTLEQLLGEGGMGEVWVAKQSEPVKRKVALKLIKAGMDSKSVIARFEQERQALALMDHPNIAKVLDGGIDASGGRESPESGAPSTAHAHTQLANAPRSGRPFFVMELVNGLPLTRFCDEAKLGITERLELFVPICQAVQHAHQKGIVHRDLKPTNILVTLIDGKPVPKVIDFGVAKATSGRLTEASLSTQFGAVVGTLEYMSPEQAGYSNQDIDTRADIYSLGVILYELLTGLRPFDSARLKLAALDEMIRIIREEEPSKPSTRLSTDESLPSLAAIRHIEPAKLTALLRGELDWVVMKCLEKQRDRRYSTTNDLMRDIQRYLAHEPVEARPPNTAYRLRKFLRRHRGPVIAASLVLLALVLGIIGTTIGFFRAAQAADMERLAKDAALSEREKALQATAKEKEAREHEERERRYAQAIAQFVKDDFLAMTSVEGQGRFGKKEGEALGKDTTLLQLLDRAATKLDARTDLDPRIEAELRWMIGVSFRHQGEFTKATQHLERCVILRQPLLGPEHPDTLAALNSLAVAYQNNGEFKKALPLLEAIAKHQKPTLGADHPARYRTLFNLAETYREAGRFDLALPLLLETLQFSKASLGLNHPDTLATMNSLAVAYRDADQLDKALPLYEETYQLRKAHLGSNDPNTLISMNNLAEAYRATGQFTKALPLLKETLQLTQATLGAEHPHTLTAMNNLAMGYQAVNQMALALPLYEETYRLTKVKLGARHPNTLTAMNSLALAYQAVGKIDKALPLLEEAQKTAQATFGTDHPNTFVAMNNLAKAYQTAGQFDKALPLFEETLRLRQAKLGLDHAYTLGSMNSLANAYRAAGQLKKALPMYEATCLAIEKQRFQHVYARAFLGNTIAAYEADKQFAAAEAWRRKQLTLVMVQAGADSPAYAQELADLGANLLSQKKYTEAEPLLLKGYKSIKSHIEKTTGADAIRLLGERRMTEALDRLLALYTETNKPDEVKTWQAERDKLNKK